MPAAQGNQSRTPSGAAALRRLRPKLRRLIAKSWILSRCYYPLRGHRLSGRAKDEIWYFAYGANMHDSAFGSDAASSRSNIVPAASKVIGYASISEAVPVERPPLQTCSPTRTRKFGACSTE